MDKQAIIDDIMDHFDFARVQCAMEAVEWTWRRCDDEVPGETEIRKTGRGLLLEVLEEDEGYTAYYGGLLATRFEDGAKLCFEMDSWDAYSEEDEESDGADGTPFQHVLDVFHQAVADKLNEEEADEVKAEADRRLNGRLGYVCPKRKLCLDINEALGEFLKSFE